MRKKDELYTTNAYGMPADPKRKSLEEPDTRSALARRHRAYGKFFEGYTERRELINGRARIVRIYTGTLYRQELTQRQARRVRWGYVAVFMFSVLLLILALSLPTQSNNRWYVSLCALAAAGFYGWVLLSLHTYVWSKRELTIYEYHYGSIALQRRPAFAAGAVLIPLAGAAAMLVRDALPFTSLEFLRDVLLVFSGCVMYSLRVLEGRIRYTTVESEDKPV